MQFMSIEDLLADPKDSPKWKAQRKRLIRILSGISVIALALGGGALLWVSTKRQAVKEPSASTEMEAKSLAQLMRLQQETQQLRERVEHLKSRSPQSVAADQVSRSRTPKRNGEGQESARIFSYDPGDGFATVDVSQKDMYIPTGAVFQAELLTPIKTSVERTFVMAQTTVEFRMDMKRKIPAGTRLVGRSHLDPILKGVVVDFDTMVFPTGIEVNFNGLALSRDALPEIEGLYFSDALRTYGTALAFGFLSGMADASRLRRVTPFGYQSDWSISDQVMAGLSTASFQVAESILRDIRTRAIEYVVVPAGEQIFVVLTRKYQLAQGAVK